MKWKRNMAQRPPFADRSEPLRSVRSVSGSSRRSGPVRFGVRRSITLSRLMHVATVVVMAGLWRAADLPALYLAGVGCVAVLLAYEQSLVSHDDLSQVKKAFDLNGYVGIVYLVTTALAIYLG